MDNEDEPKASVMAMRESTANSIGHNEALAASYDQMTEVMDCNPPEVVGWFQDHPEPMTAILFRQQRSLELVSAAAKRFRQALAKRHARVSGIVTDPQSG
jgi:hypothetical protein